MTLPIKWAFMDEDKPSGAVFIQAPTFREALDRMQADGSRQLLVAAIPGDAFREVQAKRARYDDLFLRLEPLDEAEEGELYRLREELGLPDPLANPRDVRVERAVSQLTDFLANHTALGSIDGSAARSIASRVIEAGWRKRG